jgi:hypothetical protein
MKFGVFNKLEELDAHFYLASVESLKELSRITPKLKKIVLCSASSDTINALLAALENLESLKFQSHSWEVPNKIYPKIKHLDASCKLQLNADQFPKQFPNLEYLKLNGCSIHSTESFFALLLSGLKRLKTLHMDIKSASLVNPEPILPCFQEHGKNLEEVQVKIVSSVNDCDYHVFNIRKKAGNCFSFDNHTGSWDSDH